MAEVSKNAMTLISISWQALNRAIKGNKDANICDCTVIILFASIFIESNINDIIERMDMTEEMFEDLHNRRPGLQLKLCWFYNKFIARNKVAKWDKKSKREIEKKLWRKFSVYRKIYKYRNDISHGFVDQSIGNLEQVKLLRQKAKDIVDELFKIIKKKGYDIPRTITYQDVVQLNKGENDASLKISNRIMIIPVSESS